MNRVIIFTMSDCIYCQRLKKRLDQISIPYINADISENSELWEEVVNQTKQDVVPTVFITPEDSDTGQLFVPTIDYQTEDEIVEIIKKHFL